MGEGKSAACLHPHGRKSSPLSKISIHNNCLKIRQIEFLVKAVKAKNKDDKVVIRTRASHQGRRLGRETAYQSDAHLSQRKIILSLR